MKHSIEELHNLLVKGELTPGDVLDAYLARIHEDDARLKAFIQVFQPDAVPFEDDLPLSGAVIAVKDLFDIPGVPTTAGASFWTNNLATDESEAVGRLINAGVKIIGKTNMHEIALGVTSANPYFGVCRNPWDDQRIPGGSSGGSAVAVATGMCTAALGTDTGGSIRIPSALCGVVGLKPTYGRISLRGVIPLSWNLDHVGPICNCVRDAALLLKVLAGTDPDDPTSVNEPVGDYLKDIEAGVSGLCIGVVSEEDLGECHPEVLAAFRQSVKVMADLGAKIIQVQVPWLREAALANGIMTQADAAAFHREHLSLDPPPFGDDVLRRLLIGKNTSSTDYALARKIQKEIKLKFKRLLETCELFLLPTTPEYAPLIAGRDAVEIARKLTRFTAPFNLAGLPALTVPCGLSTEGMPMGLQLVGAEWTEALVLRAGRAFEKSVDWRQRNSYQS